MKRKHRLYTSALALSLLAGVPAVSASMMLPIVAAESTCTITIDGYESDVTYTAYQIFSGTPSEGDILSDIGWGTGINADGLKTALTEKGITAESSAADVAKIVTANTSGFLAAVRDNKKEGSGKANDTGAGTISGLQPGYYLITEKRGADGAEEAFIMEVVNTTTSIKPKTSSAPNREKHVHENGQDATNNLITVKDGSGYQDVADYAIGEEISFILTAGNVPTAEKIESWNKYVLTFTDTASKGLDITDVEARWAEINADTKEVTLGDLISEDLFNAVGPETAEDGKKTYTYTVTIKENGKYKATAHSGKSVVLLVKGKLNKDAAVNVPGSYDAANFNEYTLTYTANPEGEEKTTEADKTLVFTYQLDVTKVDGANADTKLTDAKFVLFKEENEVKTYYKVDADGNVSFVADKTAATVLSTDNGGTFTVKGLDEGTYYLEETQTPVGYNTLAGYVKVVVSANKLNTDYVDQTMDGVNGLTVTTTVVDKTTKETLDPNAEAQNGTTITVANNKGTKLPSTGGMGTTMFYTVGGLMVAGAAIFMITGKRMKKED